MNATSTNLVASDTVVPAAEAHPDPAGRDDVARGPGLARWRVALESRWQRKLDEAIALSRACYGLSLADDGSLGQRPVRRSRRLCARTAEAYEELAAIEDAMARVDDGSYGLCADCARVMPDDWLAGTPEARHCPDCSLHMAPRLPPSAQQAEVGGGVWRPSPKPAVGVRRRQPRPAWPGSA